MDTELSSSTAGEYPHEQLRLVHDELNRQRERVRAASTNMQFRASVLIGAAAIFTGFRTVHHLTAWDTAAALAGFVAAVLGLISVRATHGDEVIMQKLHDSALSAGMDIYSAEFGLVKDKLAAHAFDVRALEHRRVLVNVGFVVLALAWATDIAATLVMNG